MDLEALRQNRKGYAAQLEPERRPIGILFVLLTLHLCLELGISLGRGILELCRISVLGIQFQLKELIILSSIYICFNWESHQTPS